MMRLIALLPIVTMVISSSAKADWQYTKWGMTPQQVASASSGSVSVGGGSSNQEIPGETIGATGTYAAGDFRFAANFHFTGGKLVDIRLQLVSGEGWTLKNALDGKYGAPFA